MDDDLEASVAAAQRGDDVAFSRLVDRFRPELQLHCYRLLGSLDDAEDAVQDVLLDAWRSLPGFEGRASVRTWLYRIATNACLGRRRRARRRRDLLEAKVVDAVAMPLPMSVPWLQPYPDAQLDLVAARSPDPEHRLTARESVEIGLIAALQHLPARQRAVLVLRDLVGWRAERCAQELDTTVPAVNSALQRARSALRGLLGPDREDWPARRLDDARSREIVQRYIDAIEHSDDAAIAALLRDDVVVSHQPGAGGNDSVEPAWYAGREEVVAAWAPALHGPQRLEMRMVEAWVNRMPAVVSSIRLPGTTEHRAFAHSILDIRVDGIVAVVNLLPERRARH